MTLEEYNLSPNIGQNSYLLSSFPSKKRAFSNRELLEKSNTRLATTLFVEES